MDEGVAPDKVDEKVRPLDSEKQVTDLQVMAQSQSLSEDKPSHEQQPRQVGEEDPEFAEMAVQDES